MKGVKVGGRNINNLRYADDTTLIAGSNDDLQRMLDKVIMESEKAGMHLNTKKTVCMVISKKKDKPVCKITVHGKELQQVEEFCFLGSTITSSGKTDREIIRRIAMAKDAFQRMKNILVSKRINKMSRIRLIRCYIWSVLLYGCETWTVTKELQRRLEAAEMWFLRRLLKIPWTARKSNEDVLKEAGTTRTLINSIRRQLKFLGHVMRQQNMENLVMTGKIEGRRSRGRPRQKYLDCLGNGFVEKRTPIQLIRGTADRASWRAMIANVG